MIAGNTRIGFLSTFLCQLPFLLLSISFFLYISLSYTHSHITLSKLKIKYFCVYIFNKNTGKDNISQTYCTELWPKEARKWLLAVTVLSTYISVRRPSAGGLSHPCSQHENRSFIYSNWLDFPVSSWI